MGSFRKSKVKSQTEKSDAIDISTLSPGEVSIYRMDVTLVGANKNVQPVFEQPTGYYENYYLAHTGENGVQAKGYNRVVYKNVYPNIDWVIYTKSKVKSQNLKPGNINDDATGEAVLKYDFIIHPGGNVADIRMRYEGATELKIEDGALVAVTPYGSITEDAPYSYAPDGGREVTSKYILEGNELRFDVGSHSGTLVIDPVQVWGTYYHKENNLNVLASSGVAVDTAGNSFLSNETNLTNIATNGSYQMQIAAQYDLYLVKFDIDGDRAWCTYFGGTGYEESGGIAADRLNGIYIGGGTTSTDTIMGSTGVYQSLHPGVKAVGNPGFSLQKAFIARFNTITGRKEWSTYYGDSMWSDIKNMSSDTLGNVYIFGSLDTDGVHTHSYATSGAFMTTNPSGASYYMAKFNKNGQRLWGSFIGGLAAIVPDDAGNAYITGGDNGSAYGTSGTHQPSNAGGSDAFLVKIGTSGQRIWGTYYGGTGTDFGLGIVRYKNSVFLTGATRSSSGIATANPHQAALVGTQDGFLAKFNAANGTIDWGTYYGGNETVIFDELAHIAVGSGGDVFAYGHTSSASGIATPVAHKTTYGGAVDCMLLRFSNSGKLKWGSYFGGAGMEYVYNDHSSSIAYVNNHVYICGHTGSGPTGITTPNTYQPVLVGVGGGTFLSMFNIPDTSVYITPAFTDTLVCAGDTLKVPYSVTTKFNSSNAFKVLLSNSSGSFASPTVLATVTNNTHGTVACYIPTGTAAGSGYRIKITASSPIDTSADNDFNIRISNYPAAFSASVNKTALCTADTLKLNSSTSTTSVTYVWSGPNSFTAGTANTTIPNPSLAATGSYYIAIDNKGCVARDTFAVTVTQSPENVTATNNGPVCTGDTLRMYSSSTTGGVTYKWSPGNYSTQNVTIPNVAKNQGGVYTVTATLGNCTTTATTTAQVEQAPVINIVPTAGVALCIGELAQFAAFLNDAGTNPQMIWQVNGVDKAGETTSTFKTATLNHGDKVRLKVIPNTSCPGTRYSNEITMGIYAPKAPTVSIVADKNPPWHDNTIVTFMATAANATSVTGVPPTYQWKKNGQDIGGAISNYWAVNTNALNDNDKICVQVTSAYECPVPDSVLSNCINSRFTGVEDVATSSIKVYPNPVTNLLHIDGLATGHSVALYDVVSRKCNVTYQDGSIDMSGLPAGNYVLQVTDANGERAYFKVTKE